MEEIQISIDIIRVQTMIYAINTHRLNDRQLNRLTRYLFSDEFAEEFIEMDNSDITPEEKKNAFTRMYNRSITPLEILN